LQALANVEQAGPAPREFLRAAGRFIESWVPGENRDDEVDRILQRRDESCYRPDPSGPPFASEERRKILAHLRTRALSGLAILFAIAASLLPVSAEPALSPAPEALYRQAEAAWSEGAYHAAIDFYREAHPDGEVPADVLYNIGNCYFQIGEPGLAALSYRRAISQQPRHPEASQNLRFLKRKTGAITIVHPAHQQFLGKLNRSVFSSLLSLGIWTSALALLALYAALPKSARIFLGAGLTAGPLAAVTGGVCLALYPSGAEFAPVSEQAVVISPDAITARTEASVGGAEVISVPPGSLCRPLAHRGPWTYVELADETRGWLPSQSIRPIIPAPEPVSPSNADLGA
jgi:tetratricopeptide (TPR) repeat protein